MNPLIEAHRDELANLCRQHGVLQLEVFGSATRDDFRAGESDLDLIARFTETDKPGYADRFMGFIEDLERLMGTRVDLLTEGSLRNPIFIRNIAADRKVIYVA